MFDELNLLGVNAYFSADMVLLVYLILIIPLMLVGFGLVRRKRLRYHRGLMTAIMLVNWLPIGLVMIPSFFGGVAPALPAELGDFFIFTPTLHAVVGISGQALATYLVIRMWFDRSNSRFLMVQYFKPYMRVILTLWLLSAGMGVATYAVWYIGAQPIASAATDPEMAGLQVELRQLAFAPGELTVTAGETVTWVNHERALHQVDFDDGRAASENLRKGDTFTFTFDQTGTYPLYCPLHGAPGGLGMAMVVHVTGADE